MVHWYRKVVTESFVCLVSQSRNNCIINASRSELVVSRELRCVPSPICRYSSSYRAESDEVVSNSVSTRRSAPKCLDCAKRFIEAELEENI